MQDENNDFSQTIQTPVDPVQAGFDQNQQPQKLFQPFTQPAYVPVPAASVPKRGKGFAIASMVLGIIGLPYYFLMFIISLVFMSEPNLMIHDSYNTSGFDPIVALRVGLVAMTVLGSVFAVLSLIFAFVARTKGCRNGISIAGLVISVISFIMIGFTILFSFI